MMRTKLLFFLSLYMVSLTAVAQTRLRKRTLELQLKPAAGINLPVSKMLGGAVTDHLLKYDDRHYYWQFIAANLFFHKHWGISFEWQPGSSNRIVRKQDQFRRAMEDMYGHQYYVNNAFPSYYLRESNFMVGDMSRGLLGVIYRLEHKRFFLYPQLSIGTTAFDNQYGRVYLKEKGTNQVTAVYYEAGKVAKDHFTVAASTAAGWKLKRWLYLQVQVQTSYFKSRSNYLKTVTNNYSGQRTQEYIRYRKGVLSVGIGGGFLIPIIRDRGVRSVLSSSLQRP